MPILREDQSHRAKTDGLFIHGQDVTAIRHAMKTLLKPLSHKIALDGISPKEYHD
jgi:hypothetical protein